ISGFAFAMNAPKTPAPQPKSSTLPDKLGKVSSSRRLPKSNSP
ncbi:hypothetical protein D039_3431B, partial [Vibrio parahaemolyticus EKP-028]